MRQSRANEQSRLRLGVVHLMVIGCDPGDYCALVSSVFRPLLWDITERSLIFFPCIDIALYSPHWRPLKWTLCLFSSAGELQDSVLSKVLRQMSFSPLHH